MSREIMMPDDVGFDDIWYYTKREGFILPSLDGITLLWYNEQLVYRWKPKTFSCFELSLVAYAYLVEPDKYHN